MSHASLALTIFTLFTASLNCCFAELKPDRSVVYKKIGNITLKLDVFEPNDLKKSDTRPAIVFFFGGGWNGGSPSQFYDQARALADQGMVAFSANYRVRSRHKTTPFECVKDGKSAIRWVRENAANLGIDPHRIVASGGSAGGHVAACTGTIKGTEEAGEDLKTSSEPNAMILFNPVLDTSKTGFGSARFSEEQQTTISPCHHIRKDLPPTIIFHGTRDTTVAFENAERFTDLMKKAGNRCELIAFKGSKHGFFNKRKDAKAYEKTVKASITFLQSLEYIKNRASPRY
ncbi:MAG: alpha/beta hydrolase [Akkermansiaceae bacterium]